MLKLYHTQYKNNVNNHEKLYEYRNSNHLREGNGKPLLNS